MTDACGERGDGPADEFGIAARDRYPAYVEWLRDRTGIAVPLNRAGIIQAAITEAGGVLTDWSGSPTAFGGGAIATNGALSKTVRDILVRTDR